MPPTSFAERARRFLAERESVADTGCEKSETSETRSEPPALAPEPHILPMARNILALTPEEVTAYRAEVAAASPDDPDVRDDRAALALADRLREEAN